MAAQSTPRQQARTSIPMAQAHTTDSSATPPNYEHKKFSVLKRKRSQDEEADDDVIFVMEERPAKRPFFRPWLDEPRTVITPAQEQPPRRPSPTTVATTYHANMVRSHTPRLRSPKAQQRRDRNTLACLLSRRARQAKQMAMEQQYDQFRQQHEANLEQQVRLSLYYVRFLQQAMAATRSPLPAAAASQTKLQDIQQDWPHHQTTAMRR